jgi:hypothetical protein
MILGCLIVDDYGVAAAYPSVVSSDHEYCYDLQGQHLYILFCLPGSFPYSI